MSLKNRERIDERARKMSFDKVEKGKSIENRFRED